MKTIALRFGETFSPVCGTIAAHQSVIDELGYVWYGKLGSTIADKVISEVLKADEKKILLIHSGSFDRYWAYFEEITKETPTCGIPAYYANKASEFRVWFKIIRFEKAPKDIMGSCIVVSSRNPLSLASRRSMNPCFFIEYNENDCEG